MTEDNYPRVEWHDADDPRTERDHSVRHVVIGRDTPPDVVRRVAEETGCIPRFFDEMGSPDD
jgi:hypothetical protein